MAKAFFYSTFEEHLQQVHPQEQETFSQSHPLKLVMQKLIKKMFNHAHQSSLVTLFRISQ